MPKLASRSVPFQAGCEMLGLHKEPEFKAKSGFLVNRAKLVYGVTTLAVFTLVVCLTVLSITSQKSKTIPVLQAEFFEEEISSSTDKSDNTTSFESSTEALKYLVVSHPRRSKSVDGPWHNNRGTSYNDGYAQLETYRNTKKVHSVSDILRYMHGERTVPVKLTGKWVKTPSNTDSNTGPGIPPYHWDNLNKYKPTSPSEINKLATKIQPNLGPRFSTRVPRPSVGPFKPLPEYPTHTQAIFHPYSLEGENDEVDKSKPKRKAIGGNEEQGDIDRGSNQVKPFSVLLDIYPVPVTTPTPKDRRILRGTKVVPLQVNVPPLTQIHIRKPRPPPPSIKPTTPQRMILHLNLHPKKNKQNGRNNKEQNEVHVRVPTLDPHFNQVTDDNDVFQEAVSSTNLNLQRLSGPKSSNYTNATVSRIIQWCYHYENDLIREKSLLFITILRSLCKNFNSNNSSETSSQEDDSGENLFGRYAKLTQKIDNSTQIPSESLEVVDEKENINPSLDTATSYLSLEEQQTTDSPTTTTIKPRTKRRRGRINRAPTSSTTQIPSRSRRNYSKYINTESTSAISID